MNDPEKRRQLLLAQTRERLGDERDMPAVHPRYRASWQNLYDGEEESAGTFGARLLLCVMLLAAFVSMDMHGQEIFHINSDTIAGAVTADFTAAGVQNCLDQVEAFAAGTSDK